MMNELSIIRWLLTCVMPLLGPNLEHHYNPKMPIIRPLPLTPNVSIHNRLLGGITCARWYVDLYIRDVDYVIDEIDYREEEVLGLLAVSFDGTRKLLRFPRDSYADGYRWQITDYYGSDHTCMFRVECLSNPHELNIAASQRGSEGKWATSWYGYTGTPDLAAGRFVGVESGHR